MEAVGAAASLIQLASNALDVSKGLYGFFSAIRNSKREFESITSSTWILCPLLNMFTNMGWSKSAIKGVHEALQMLDQFAKCFGDSLEPGRCRVLENYLRDVESDLSSLSKMVKKRNPEKVINRIIMVLKKPEVSEMLVRLESRKSSIMLFLQAMQM